MNTVRTIGWLAAANLALSPLYIGVSIYTERMLPEQLQKYLEIQATATVSSIEFISFLFFTVVYISFIVSLIGIIKKEIWARKLFLVTAVLGIASNVLAGPYVESSISSALSHASALVTGMLMSLLLFTNSYQLAARKSMSKALNVILYFVVACVLLFALTL